MNPTDLDDDDADTAKVLIEQLRALLNLSEGELYILRRGLLQQVQHRDEDNGLRRIRVMEEAYDAAYALARQLRPLMRGYRPDPALVISALVMTAVQRDDALQTTQHYLQGLFSAPH